MVDAIGRGDELRLLHEIAHSLAHRGCKEDFVDVGDAGNLVALAHREARVAGALGDFEEFRDASALRPPRTRERATSPEILARWRRISAISAAMFCVTAGGTGSSILRGFAGLQPTAMVKAEAVFPYQGAYYVYK